MDGDCPLIFVMQALQVYTAESQIESRRKRLQLGEEGQRSRRAVLFALGIKNRGRKQACGHAAEW